MALTKQTRLTARQVLTTIYGSVQTAFDNLRNGTFSLGYGNTTVDKRLDNTKSVLSISGVVGDGIHDDQPAIQAYINGMTSGSLYFPGGYTYLFGNPLVVNNNGLYIHGDRGYAGGHSSLVVCGRANMAAFQMRGYGSRTEDLGIRGFEVLADDVAFGQTTTCTGIEYLRGDGSKDIDSEASRLQMQHLKYGVYASGCNLSITDCLFTSVLYPNYYVQLPGNEIRGMIVQRNRYHHLGGGGAALAGTYPELLGSSCVTILGNFSRGNVIDNNYADAQIRTLFKGQLGRACSLSNNVILRAEGDIFIIDNTALGAANESFTSSGNILVNDAPDAAVHSGYMYNLKAVTSANLYGNTGNYLRKGGVYAVGCHYLSVCDFVFVNINTNFAVDGLIYSGVYFDSTSTNNYVNGISIRCTLGPSYKAVVSNDGQYNHFLNFSSHGAGTSTPFAEGTGAISTGVLDARRRKRREDFGDLPPTTGNYLRGDIRWKLSTSSGGWAAWICTVDGTPGTWVETSEIRS